MLVNFSLGWPKVDVNAALKSIFAKIGSPPSVENLVLYSRPKGKMSREISTAFRNGHLSSFRAFTLIASSQNGKHDSIKVTELQTVRNQTQRIHAIQRRIELLPSSHGLTASSRSS